MRIWIDFSNSPHPLLFAPIARTLEQRGHVVLVTARANAQTVELARQTWPDVKVIGGVSPKGKAAKATAMLRRGVELRNWARVTRPDVALSHNSYAQIMAARVLRIPAVTAMDFEHQPANHVAFRLASRVLLPAALANAAMQRQGATTRKTHFYEGLKEEVYLGDFRPDPNALRSLGVVWSRDAKLVVARPEPDQAAYHSFKNPLFVDCLRSVLRDENVGVVVLPRHAEQRQALRTLALDRLVVPDRAVDSRSLMSQADLMIGAGGTMTREAALMGVPTMSLFAGRRPAVDEWLERAGRLKTVKQVKDLPSVERCSRADRLAALRERGSKLVSEFCNVAIAAGEGE